MMAILLAGLAAFTKTNGDFSRAWFGIWMVTALILLVGYRLLLISFLRFMRSHGLNERRVVIFGAGELGGRFAQTVQQALWTGYRIVTFF